ncbi:MAG: aminopeptidase P family protein, partial [Devosiaceae bacterium]|nr:aminopeptidase P family protein [Devosiaceae bacterium]
KKAALFVDGRYVLQGPAQTDINLIEVLETSPTKIATWIKENFSEGVKIGFDAWLHTRAEIKKLEKELAGFAKLLPVENPVDMVWKDRPAPPFGNIEFLGIERSGKVASEKLAQLQATIANKKCTAIILTLPENICWLFNMRGRDVPNTPLVLAFAIVPVVGTPTLYLEDKNIGHDSLLALDAIAHLASKDEFINDINRLTKTSAKIWLDEASAPQKISQNIEKSKAEIFNQADPILVMKAKKNSTELKEMKQAHLLDGIAMVKFLCWFDKYASSNELTEIDIVKSLENFRREEKTLVDISFDTISGAGANGAIVHYRVNEKSNRKLKKGELMLVDSGGQYLSGTTDITRTLYTGSASKEQKQRYTEVLKGMIALSLARFPKGTTGTQLDTLARQYLWQNGLNYNHGTGHGVGAFLSVHEGPYGISPRANLALMEGTILSNEPGFYKQGEYGIRIENLVHVKESTIGENFLEFETLTLAPIDKRLIEQKMLSKSEVKWLNNYHQMVWDRLSEHLEGEAKDWLKRATKAI